MHIHTCTYLCIFIHQQAVEYDFENPYSTPCALNTENDYTLALSLTSRQAAPQFLIRSRHCCVVQWINTTNNIVDSITNCWWINTIHNSFDVIWLFLNCVWVSIHLVLCTRWILNQTQMRNNHYYIEARCVLYMNIAVSTGVAWRRSGYIVSICRYGYPCIFGT